MKPDNSDTIKIGGSIYHVVKLGFRDGITVGARFLNLVSTGVPELQLTPESIASGDVGIQKLLGGVLNNRQLAEHVLYFCDVFAERTEVEWNEKGEPKTATLSNVIESHFAGKYDEMIAWLVFCFTANLSSFLGAFSGSKIGELLNRSSPTIPVSGS